jgi:hypothetical protein
MQKCFCIFLGTKCPIVDIQELRIKTFRVLPRDRSQVQHIQLPHISETQLPYIFEREQSDSVYFGRFCRLLTPQLQLDKHIKCRLRNAANRAAADFQKMLPRDRKPETTYAGYHTIIRQRNGSSAVAITARTSLPNSTGIACLSPHQRVQASPRDSLVRQDLIRSHTFRVRIRRRPTACIDIESCESNILLPSFW